MYGATRYIELPSITDPESQRSSSTEDHKHTNCNVQMYTSVGTTHGGYCKRCKTEFWKEGNGPWEDAEAPKVPHLWCLQVSDQNELITWENIENGFIQEGDHIAWLRGLGYWHHAIVNSTERDELEVYELDCKGIHVSKKTRKVGCNGECNDSPMYKVLYKQEMLDRNPVVRVRMRAESKIGPQCFKFCTENCEHYATFCKTGKYKSAQIIQLRGSLGGWMRKWVFLLFRAAVIISISEVVEAEVEQNTAAGVGTNALTKNQYDWVAVVMMIFLEIIYVLIVVYFLCKKDSTYYGIKKKAVVKGIIKQIGQSILYLSMSFIFSVWIRRAIEQDDWNSWKQTRVEIGLGLTGAFIGGALGFYLFFILPVFIKKWLQYLRSILS